MNDDYVMRELFIREYITVLSVFQSIALDSVIRSHIIE